MRRYLKSFGLIVPWALGVLGLFVGLSSLLEQHTGINPATTFITQSLRYESYDDIFDPSLINANPGWWFNSSVGNTNWFVDLSLRKELLGVSRSGIYRYRITVSNDGNASALDFTVKDYVSSNAFVLYASDQGLVQNNTVTWSVDTLQAGESVTFVVELKKVARADVVNKAEVCDYEETGESQDPDSASCSMGWDWLPLEDDEAIVNV